MSLSYSPKFIGVRDKHIVLVPYDTKVLLGGFLVKLYSVSSSPSPLSFTNNTGNLLLLHFKQD